MRRISKNNNRTYLHTFHLHDNPGVVFTLGGAHVTPVRASVLQICVPEEQSCVAAGYQAWQNGGSASKLLMLVVLFASLIVVIVVIIIVVVVVIIVPLELEHHHVLSEPLDGLLAGRLEAAGEQTLLRNEAGHSHI